MGNLPDPIVLIPFMFALGLAPVAAVMVTSYTKLVVVFALLRNALGLQQVPPAMVTNGLALVLTWFIMAPVMQDAVKLVNPGSEAISTDLSLPKVFEAIREPLREFLNTHASEREKTFFLEAAQRNQRPGSLETVSPTDFVVLIPAFTISELTEAFLIGFLIFLPFIVIDLIVANVLIALGMQMMSPAMVSLPIKLLLFVMLDGWARLSHALIFSYQGA